MAEESIEWVLADTNVDGTITQRKWGDLQEMPNPKGNIALQWPQVESPINQKYNGDDPAIQGWTYIPDPIIVHPGLYCFPGSDDGGTSFGSKSDEEERNPLGGVPDENADSDADKKKATMTLYLHARVTADGRMQFGIFKKVYISDSEMEWQLATTFVDGEIHNMLGGKNMYPRMPISADGEDLLYRKVVDEEGNVRYRLNLMVDPRLIGPLAPCSVVQVTDNCGGSELATLFGDWHSLWGCIWDDVLYMHLFHHDTPTSFYSGYGRPVIDIDPDGNPIYSRTCGCVKVPVDMPWSNMDECPAYCGCPPDHNDLYDALGFKYNACCGYDIRPNASKLARYIGVDSWDVDYMERTLAETVVDGTITQQYETDIYARHDLLTPHGGLYDGKWVVVHRTYEDCPRPDEGSCSWSTPQLEPHDAPVPDTWPLAPVKDTGTWTELNRQEFGEDWYKHGERLGTGGATGILYGQAGTVRIMATRFANIYELTTTHSPVMCTEIEVNIGPCCGSDSGSSSQSESISGSWTHTHSDTHSDTHPGSPSGSISGSDPCDPRDLDGGVPYNNVNKPGDATYDVDGGIFILECENAAVEVKLAVDDNGELILTNLDTGSVYSIDAALAQEDWGKITDPSFWCTEATIYLEPGRYKVTGWVYNNPSAGNNPITFRYNVRLLGSLAPTTAAVAKAAAVPVEYSEEAPYVQWDGERLYTFTLSVDGEAVSTVQGRASTMDALADTVNKAVGYQVLQDLGGVVRATYQTCADMSIELKDEDLNPLQAIELQIQCS